MSTSDSPSPTILIVDDFKPLRTFVALALQQKPNLTVSEAADGLEAIERTKEQQPDLILLDIGLPGLDGISTGRAIREFSPHSKILFVSADHSIDLVQETLSHRSTWLLSEVRPSVLSRKYLHIVARV